jgi:hypothetical protein
MMYISWNSLLLLMELSHLIYFKSTCKSSIQVWLIFLVIDNWLLFRAIQRLHICEYFSNINSLFHLISKII